MLGLIYSVLLSCLPVRRCRTFPSPAHWLLQFLQEEFNSLSASPSRSARESLLSISLALSPIPPCKAVLPSCFCHIWLSPHLSLPVLGLCYKYSWDTWSRQYPIAPGTATCGPFLYCMLTCILTWVKVTRWSPPLAVCTCFVVSDRPSF